MMERKDVDFKIRNTGFKSQHFHSIKSSWQSICVLRYKVLLSLLSASSALKSFIISLDPYLKDAYVLQFFFLYLSMFFWKLDEQSLKKLVCLGINAHLLYSSPLRDRWSNILVYFLVFLQSTGYFFKHLCLNVESIITLFKQYS